MKKIGLIAVVFTWMFTGCSVENNEPCSELSSERERVTLDVDNFSSFSVFGSDVVHLKQGERQEVSVEGHSAALAKISLLVVNDHWEIINYSCESNQMANRFDLQMDQLSELNSNGNSEIGSPDIMDLNKLNVTADDNGVVTLTGKVNTLRLIASGESRLNLAHFQAENIFISASGNSVSRIYATSSLEAIVDDNAEVIYQGGPRINAQVNGNGILRED